MFHQSRTGASVIVPFIEMLAPWAAGKSVANSWSATWDASPETDNADSDRLVARGMETWTVWLNWSSEKTNVSSSVPSENPVMVYAGVMQGRARSATIMIMNNGPALGPRLVGTAIPPFVFTPYAMILLLLTLSHGPDDCYRADKRQDDVLELGD